MVERWRKDKVSSSTETTVKMMMHIPSALLVRKYVSGATQVPATAANTDLMPKLHMLPTTWIIVGDRQFSHGYL